MNRQLMWIPRQWPGCEHLDLRVGDDGVVADGVVLAAPEGEPVRLAYRIECDRAWRTRSVVLDRHGHPRRTLTCERGHWTDNGRERPDLDGCNEVDIALSPFTNTLPIRRLDLPQGESAPVRVVYIDPTSGLDITSDEQRYTRLDTGWRIESGTFRADLDVDADGLVTVYPDLFTMVAS